MVNSNHSESREESIESFNLISILATKPREQVEIGMEDIEQHMGDLEQQMEDEDVAAAETHLRKEGNGCWNVTKRGEVRVCWGWRMIGHRLCHRRTRPVEGSSSRSSSASGDQRNHITCRTHSNSRLVL